MALVASGMNQVNAVILDRMQSQIHLIPELAGHLIASGGKRMRPMLTLATSALLDYPGSRQYKLAASVEFIHTATLLHDDVVDHSDLRRGRKTANVIWGNSASVLVGDFLFSRAFELMVEDGSLKVLKILSGASAVISEGEVNQLTAQRQIATTEDRYLDIIGAKTAALFAAACRISAVIAERDEATEMALDSYGRNLGIAFQLVDDAIDYASDDATAHIRVSDDGQWLFANVEGGVVAVPNGAAAVEALGNDTFDGAVLDGLLPKMTGFDVAKQIKALELGKPLTPFSYKDKGQMATIGRRRAVVEMPNGIKLHGTIAWLTWLALHDDSYGRPSVFSDSAIQF